MRRAGWNGQEVWDWWLTIGAEEEDCGEQSKQSDRSEVHRWRGQEPCCMNTPAKGNEEDYLWYREINTPSHPSLGEEQLTLVPHANSCAPQMLISTDSFSWLATWNPMHLCYLKAYVLCTLIELAKLPVKKLKGWGILYNRTEKCWKA